MKSEQLVLSKLQAILTHKKWQNCSSGEDAPKLNSLIHWYHLYNCPVSFAFGCCFVLRVREKVITICHGDAIHCQVKLLHNQLVYRHCKPLPCKFTKGLKCPITFNLWTAVWLPSDLNSLLRSILPWNMSGGLPDRKGQNWLVIMSKTEFSWKLIKLYWN